jgi:hypothetical protein
MPMKIKMYMYDEPIKLDDEASSLFLEQLSVAQESMKALLDVYADQSTREAMFYMMSLRSYIDDFLEFCTEDITKEEMEQLLNGNDIEEEDDDDFEIYVDFDDEEE